MSEFPQHQGRPGAHHPGTLPTPIDVAEVRRSYETALWEPVTPQRREELARLLQVHLGVLLHDVEEQLPRMQGETRAAAEYVAAQARHALTTAVGVCEEDYMQDLATLCRALLALHERRVTGVTAP